LNRYLTVMSDVILDHGGALIAYMGDGIRATFGAPTEQVDHADRALAAAQEMAGPALEEVNAWLRARGGADFKSMLTGARDDLVRLDAMRVRGKDEPVVVWSVA
jgi:class 3 adenylate cyclase